jgi:IS5 family transposase
MTRITDPQRSFADLEFAKQGVCLCPVLKTISDFIDQHPELAEEVRLDLQRGLKHPNTGRNGLAPEQVLRSLILMRIKNWDYRELRERISDGYTLRRFTGFDSKPVPKHDAFNRAFIRLTPVTIEAINDLVVRAAVKATLEDGSKLRVDTTVVQANVHHPTDSTLVWDSVRVITRLVLLMAKLIPGGVNGFRNRTRVARRRMQQIQRMTSTQRRQQQVPKYRELIQVAQSVIDSARQVLDQTKDVQGVDLMTNLALKSLRQTNRQLLYPWRPCCESGPTPCAFRRESSKRREAFLDLRASHRYHQTRQDPYPS